MAPKKAKAAAPSKSARKLRETRARKPPPRTPRTRTRKRTLQLDQQLVALEASDLIRRAQAQPELEYLFRHALVQDAAYSSLLKNNRRMLHFTIGEVLEQLYPDRLEELAPVLAVHFDEGEDHARALHYFTRAGDLAVRRFANPEAAMHYRRALDIAKSNSADAALLTHLFSTLGRTLELTGRYDDALAHYVDMQMFAHTRGDRRMELAALLARTMIHSAPTLRFDPEQAQILSAQALPLARELDDEQAEAKLLWNASLAQKFLGDWVEHVRVGEQAAALARRLNERELLAYVLNDIGEGLAAVGQRERGEAALDEAHAIFGAQNNVPMLIDNRNNLSYVHFLDGQLESALVLARETYALSERTHNLWGLVYSAIMLGYVNRELGDTAATLSALEEVLRLGAQSGFGLSLWFAPVMLTLTYLDLGDTESAIHYAHIAQANANSAFLYARGFAAAAFLQAYTMRGELDKAEATLREAERYLTISEYYSRSLVVCAIAEYALARGNPSQALAVTDEMLETAGVTNLRLALPWVLQQKARALIAQARNDDAYLVLQQARAYAEASKQRPVLWKILSVLAELAAQRDNAAEALTLRAQARAVIDFMAAHTPTADLRASFLAQPAVRAVLASEVAP